MKRSESHPIRLLFTLLLAIASFQVAATMILPALPAISAELGASPTDMSLSQSLFAAVSGLFAVALSLSDRFGRKKSLLVVVAIGIVGSLLVATSSGMLMYDIGRWLQAPAVIALPLAFLILRDNVPADKYPLYLGWLGALNLGITGLDGFLAGWITDNAGYRVIFWVAVGVGVLALLFIALLLPSTAPVRATTDWAGLSVLVVGVVLLSIGLAQAGSWGWGAPGTLALLGGGVIAVVCFVLVERVKTNPLVKVSHLASRAVWSVPLVIFLGMAGFISVIGFIMPIWSQLPAIAGGFGLTATQYSLWALPGTLLSFFVAPIAGSIARRSGWRPILIVGVSVSAVALIALALTLTSLIPAFIALAVLALMFAGAAMTAANGLGVHLSPAESPAFLPGIVSVTFSFGSSFGVALTGSVIAASGGGGFIPAVFVAAGLVVVSSLLSFAIPRTKQAVGPDAAPTVVGVGAGH